MEALSELWSTVLDALAPREDSRALSAHEMALRALIVYLIMIALVRLGERRMMARNSPFDLVLAIIIGSVASRGITGNAPLFPTLAASAMLVLVHWAAAALAYRHHRVGRLLKGDPKIIVREGKLEENEIRRSHLSDRDLEQELRRSGVTCLEDIGLALLERDGRINVIPRESLAGQGDAAASPVLRARRAATVKGVEVASHQRERDPS